jgi:2-iminobutanoate/2-iminopropanoate deaminase
VDEGSEIRTGEAPRGTGAYSQAIRAGDFVLVSGQGPLDPVTNEVVGTTTGGELRDILVEIDAVLYVPRP